MNPKLLGTFTDHLRAAACTLAAFGALLAPGTAGAAVILDPYFAGQFAEGTGARATFVDFKDDWHESNVYWNESTKSYWTGYGSAPEGFTRIGDISDWGSGIWGLVDWATLRALSPKDPLVEGYWSDRVATINHGDAQYQNCYQYPANDELEPRCLKWGAADALPSDFFSSGSEQNNWISHYTGYIRISNPGAYNFGVLYDDGFFLKIWGANGSMEEISSDFLSPRDRKGFGSDLLLGTGLYRFELGAYDRLEVGVVNLAWSVNGGSWTTVPTENLVIDPMQVPAPGTAVLLAVGFGALAAVRLRRKRG